MMAVLPTPAGPTSRGLFLRTVIPVSACEKRAEKRETSRPQDGDSLAPPRQDLDHALRLIGPAHDRIELPLLCEGRQVDPVLVQSLTGFALLAPAEDVADREATPSSSSAAAAAAAGGRRWRRASSWWERARAGGGEGADGAEPEGGRRRCGRGEARGAQLAQGGGAGRPCEHAVVSLWVFLGGGAQESERKRELGASGAALITSSDEPEKVLELSSPPRAPGSPDALVPLQGWF